MLREVPNLDRSDNIVAIHFRPAATWQIPLQEEETADYTAG